MRGIFAASVALTLLAGCFRNGESERDPSLHQGLTYTRYADRFHVIPGRGYRLLRVFNPWQNSRDITYTYILGADRGLVPDSLEGFPFIEIPVGRVVTMSTTHVAMISQLGRSGTILGASGTGFIYDAEIRDRAGAGLIREVGFDQGLNYEAIVDLDPDVVFLYGVEGNVTTTSEKLGEMGIQVVYCAEYLEPHPLGKAEWIRFFAQFYGLEKESDRFFSRVDSAYRGLVASVSGLEEKPGVMMGLPWKDTWYIAGGQSFASRLIRDAGGNYLWSDDPSCEAVPLDLESVYSRAIGADIWINPGVAGSLEELTRFDERFSELPVLERGMVFNNNARMSPGGGNDYWESGTVRPDLILADLIAVFHPDQLPDHSMFYYRKLK
jgi:iron complex transport system substrate-binding protein